MMTILSMNHVGFIYPDGHRAIDDLSFEVESGECIGLVGENGAGKSTLLLLLLGVYLPDAGEINVEGIRLDKSSAAQIRSRMGLVFQDADDQLFTNSVHEDVAFGPYNMGMSEPDVEAAVNRALEITGIPHLAARAPYKLSGGEKRLAAIASVLSMDPHILVMDEPSSSLDPRARRNLIRLLRGLPQTRIIASHDLDLVRQLCDRVIVLKDGRIQAAGETEAILSTEWLLCSDFEPGS